MENKIIFLEKVINLIHRSGLEFADVGDYIWKAPRLIESERRRETSILESYSDDFADLRENRRRLEFRKLDGAFPFLISVGNLFSVLSLFETYLFTLAQEIQKLTNRSIHDIRGNGVHRIFKYLRELDIRPEDVIYYQQVHAAIKIRNCMAHASGIIEWSKDSIEITRIIENGEYLDIEIRNDFLKRGEGFDEVKLIQSPFGVKVAVDNLYPHRLSGYLSWYFAALCKASGATLCPSKHAGSNATSK